MPSGQVVPMEPTVILAKYPFPTPKDVWFPLILGFYILCEELQDVIVGGWKDYFLHSGWLNLFDWMTASMLFVLWVFDNIYQGVIPELHIPWQIRTDTFWTLALVQSYWQTLLGLACFCMVIKGLKYTKNVPIMCNIGNTFSHAMVPVGVLLFVVFFLLLGFAIVFQIKFSTSQMNSFNNLGTSIFSVFRGLLGDIDTQGIFAASPIFGALLFCLYVTVVLFVAFTVLIALICESFSAVMHQYPQEGGVVSFIAWCQGTKHGTDDNGDTEEKQDDDSGVELQLGEARNPVYGDADELQGGLHERGTPWYQEIQVELREVQRMQQNMVREQAHGERASTARATLECSARRVITIGSTIYPTPRISASAEWWRSRGSQSLMDEITHPKPTEPGKGEERDRAVATVAASEQ
eukprot:TRINITY_DN1649_c0_g1_i8.p1 TRINITY_DN1649_c0_g1~~TRINITY_DN1649_c0_g1_i8.p1  ORF type:complete len:408 (+),score=43.17 TRINITY_DN1649_c0_g1_i8:902-2125(+)